MMGLTQVMVRRFDPALVLRLIQEERAPMALVPTMANALLNCPELRNGAISPAWRKSCSAAPRPPPS